MQVAPPKVVLDASVWVSRELRADPNHPAATAWINQHLQANGYFMEPIWFMAEVAAAISRQVSPQDAANATVLLSQLRRRRSVRFLTYEYCLDA